MGSNEDTIRNAVELFNQGRAREVMEIYDSEAIVEAPGSVVGGAYKGAEGVAQYFQKLGKLYGGGGRLHLRTIVGAGDTVVLEYVAKGRTADGREFESPAVHVFEFRGGKVVRDRLHLDTEALARAVGEL